PSSPTTTTRTTPRRSRISPGRCEATRSGCRASTTGRPTAEVPKVVSSPLSPAPPPRGGREDDPWAVRVITRGVSHRTVGPGGGGGGGHHPLLPGQGPAGAAPSRGQDHLVLRRPPGPPAPRPRPAAAWLHAHRHPALPGGRARSVGRGAGRGRDHAGGARDPDHRRARLAKRHRSAPAQDPG